jgi:CelD/BcsL family acetyltransferase involved in cellulose biosynthesis
MTLQASPSSRLGSLGLPLRRVSFEDIGRRDWDRLLAMTPIATPFSRWTFHRAWWDAYGASSEPHYLVLGEADLRAIVPLMVRRPAAGPGGSVYLAAAYHSDYATALGDPRDMTAVAGATATYLAELLAEDPSIERVDLRRLRRGDPFLDHLRHEALERAADLGWRVDRSQEDVCPTIALGSDWNDLLGRLGKKARHEVRRKLRRAQAEGLVQLRYLTLDAAAAERFIGLHQARWGSAGLFAETDDGERSRAFLHRLVELESAEGTSAQLHLGEVVVGDRVVYALAGFAAEGRCYFYNAGMEPAALELSPGVIGTATYLRDRIAAGDTTFDFLRGDEPYKYGWGATDEAIYRLVIETASTS